MDDGVDVRLVVPPGTTAPAPPAAGTPDVPVDAGAPPSSGGLPRTGAELTAVVVVAVLLLALGVLLVKAGLARRHRPA